MMKQNIAGMSLKGGKNNRFYFCVLEYFADQDRYFLKSLLQIKDETNSRTASGDDIIRDWILKYELNEMIVDFPLSRPPCHSCLLDCPGLEKCPVKEVSIVKHKISDLLSEDYKKIEKSPKEYERHRNRDDEYDFHRDVLSSKSSEHLLSRSFKRRLKKGFLPYWNRPLDMWIWSQYYDQLLNYFNQSFDSFGNTSLMILSRFSYLKRHFPKKLQLYEAYTSIILIELLRFKVILKKDLDRLFSLEEVGGARLDIILKIERSLGIFIYEADLEILSKNSRAFESFLLALAGQCLHLDQYVKLPKWTLPHEAHFIIPSFA